MSEREGRHESRMLEEESVVRGGRFERRVDSGKLVRSIRLRSRAVTLDHARQATHLEAL